MGKIIIEVKKEEEAGMAFVFTTDHKGYMFQINDKVDFYEQMNTKKFIGSETAAFIENWNISEGHYVTDEAGWITDLVLSTDSIKWVKFI